MVICRAQSNSVGPQLSDVNLKRRLLKAVIFFKQVSDLELENSATARCTVLYLMK